jgi:RNA polymerase sigma-54 factor
MQKQQLSQKMLQKLSPQQIQLMKLLQIPTDMLEQRIQEELEGNPALELDENIGTDNEPEEKEIDDDNDFDEESYIIGADGNNFTILYSHCFRCTEVIINGIDLCMMYN